MWHQLIYKSIKLFFLRMKKDYSLLKNKKILVTGGLGFIGSNLALRLENIGAKVTLTDISMNNKYRLAPKENNFEIIESDIANYDDVRVLVENKDIIFHLAAQTSHSFSMKRPLLDTQINVLGTLNILEAIRHQNPSGRLVFTSTKGVTGIPSKIPVDEETPVDPLDIYSANKLLLEYYCKIYRNHFGLKYTIIRLTNVFGPRQQISSPSMGILNFFIGQALKDKEITIYGEGNQLRDYNYIDNVIDALLLSAIKKSAIGEIFYLGSNIGTKFRDMAEEIVETVGKGKIVYIPYPENAKKIEVGDFIVNPKKLKEKLNWEPRVSFKEGIKKTVEFYKNHPEYLNLG